MPRPESWRLDPANYPFHHRAETRFRDLDVLGHINNVAMMGLLDHGRSVFHRAFTFERRAPGERWLTVSATVDFIGESHYPEPLDIYAGIARIGTSSWDDYVFAMQGGEPKAVGVWTLVCTDKNGPTRLRDEVRTGFADWMMRLPA